jgi:formylglycine-generating enzyme required for sulfatase activity
MFLSPSWLLEGCVVKFIARTSVALFVFLQIGGFAFALEGTKRAQALLDADLQAIVKIVVEGNWPNGDPRPAEEGTGFFVYSANHWSFLLTATHVIGSSELDQNKNPDWHVENGEISRIISIYKFDEHGNPIKLSGTVSVGPKLVDGADISVMMLNQDGYRTLPLVDKLMDKTETRDVVLFGIKVGSNGVSMPLNVGSGALDSFHTYKTTIPSQKGESGGPWIDLETGKVLAVAREVQTKQGNPSNDATPVGLILSALGGYFAVASKADNNLADIKASDQVVWKFISNTNRAGELVNFIDRFPNSPLRSSAQSRLVALQVPLPISPGSTPSSDLSCNAAVSRISLEGRSAEPLSAGEECSLRPKTEFTECDECPKMVVVPAGSFTMGSDLNELGRFGDEGPQIDVKIGKEFAVGKFLITRDEFGSFVKEQDYHGGDDCYIRNVQGGGYIAKKGYSWRNPGFRQSGSHPAACLNWADATAYINWLAKKTGRDYKLLSEAEWEYAARGQTKLGIYPPFFFGSDPRDLCKYGNGNPSFTDELGQRAYYCNDGYQFTSPVGNYLPNAFGLYDMFGNLLEWTADCYQDSHARASSDGSPRIAKDCALRVLRGGSWDTLPSGLRASFRRRGDPAIRISDVGFRVARTIRH